jgi:hypothetical protein
MKLLIKMTIRFWFSCVFLGHFGGGRMDCRRKKRTQRAWTKGDKEGETMGMKGRWKLGWEGAERKEEENLGQGKRKGEEVKKSQKTKGKRRGRIGWTNLGWKRRTYGEADLGLGKKNKSWIKVGEARNGLASQNKLKEQSRRLEEM